MCHQHGIKRTRISPQAAEARRLKEQSKIETYIVLQATILSKVSPNDPSSEFESR